jgi:hypothetical protein
VRLDGPQDHQFWCCGEEKNLISLMGIKFH